MSAKLSAEDRILWNKVAQTATPLKGKTVPEVEEDKRTFEEFLTKAIGDVPPPVATAAKPQTPKPRLDPHPFDQQTRDKLAKGRLPIGGTVDLHGLTQAEAHSLLLSFLHRAHAGGMRYVLVITGKGASFGSDGALKRAVPQWLSTPPFRSLVSSHDNAARHHGGSGALYLRLRRQREARKA